MKRKVILTASLVFQVSLSTWAANPKSIICDNHSYGYHDEDGLLNTMAYTLARDDSDKYTFTYQTFKRKLKTDPLVPATSVHLLENANCTFDKDDQIIFFCMDIPLDQVDTFDGDIASKVQMSRITKRYIWPTQEPKDLLTYDQMVYSKSHFLERENRSGKYPKFESLQPEPWGHSKELWIKRDCKVEL